MSITTVTITDDDPAGTVQFGQLGYAVVEGGTAIITVTRTGTSSPVAVSFATSNGTASAAGRLRRDAPGSFTFLAGETTKTFTVTTASDATHRGQRVGEPDAVESHQRPGARHPEHGHAVDPRPPADGAVRRDRPPR